MDNNLTAKPAVAAPVSRWPLAHFGRAELGLALIAAIYAACGYALAVRHGVAENFSLLIYSDAIGLATLMLALAFLCGRIVYIMAFIRPRRLTAFILKDFRNFLLEHGRLPRAVPVLIAFLVLMSVFTSVKMMIPVVQPFAWDETLAALDRLLHGGVDPWRLLHPVLGYPPVTTVINFIYNMWFFVMFGALYWQLFAVKDPQLRMQFFYSFFLSWILNGTLLAIGFSSAGPCFFEEFTGKDYYAPLMDYLRGAKEISPVWALATQDMLLQTYREYGVALGAGISAMPSLHVSVAFLIALSCWRTDRRAGVALTAFLVCIVVGAVHLGWHYAVDAYASLLTTWLIWRFSFWLTSRLCGGYPPAFCAPARADIAA